MLCFLAVTRREQKEAAKGTHGLFARENGPKLSYYDQVDLFRSIVKFNFRAAPALLSLCPGNYK